MPAVLAFDFGLHVRRERAFSTVDKVHDRLRLTREMTIDMQIETRHAEKRRLDGRSEAQSALHPRSAAWSCLRVHATISV